MDKIKAQSVLSAAGVEFLEKGGLESLTNYVSWRPGEYRISLDGLFTADELEAMAWYMKLKEEEQHGNSQTM